MYDKQKEIFKALSINDKYGVLTNIIEAEISFLNEDEGMEDYAEYWQQQLETLGSLNTHDAFENIAFNHIEIMEALPKDANSI